MIDYHCHLLPGLDDGAKSVEEAVLMAAALANFGFQSVCCTPHCIQNHYEYPPDQIKGAVAALQRILDQAAIPLKLQSGMEYYLDGGFEKFTDNLLPLGDSRLLLCEAPPQVYPEMVVELVGLIVARGYIPLLAHPERSDVVWSLLEGEVKPATVDQKGDDATPGSLWQRLTGACRPAVKRVAIPGSRELPAETLFQANLGSFAGYYGPQPQLRAYQLLRRGAYSCLASDLHEGEMADVFLASAREKLLANPLLGRIGNFNVFTDLS